MLGVRSEERNVGSEGVVFFVQRGWRVSKMRRVSGGIIILIIIHNILRERERGRECEGSIAKIIKKKKKEKKERDINVYRI